MKTGEDLLDLREKKFSMNPTGKKIEKQKNCRKGHEQCRTGGYELDTMSLLFGGKEICKDCGKGFDDEILTNKLRRYLCLQERR